MKAQQPLSALPRPVLRWAGSKQRLLRDLIDVLPRDYGTYYEPFMGSAALFFLLEPRRAVLSDTCSPLVQVYQTLSRHAAEVHEKLTILDPLDKDMYYAIRAERPSDPITRTAYFIYLNRACWNGLYRVNSKGEFNVPYGAPKTANLPDLQHLLACGRALQQPGVSLRVTDFADAVKGVNTGDLVFFDPPYVTGHNNNGFVDYNETLFSWSDQERLAALAHSLADRGVHVMVTNAMHDAVLQLYRGFQVKQIVRSSTLANDSKFRRPVSEALIHSKA